MAFPTASSHSTNASWNALPTELKLVILDHLDLANVHAFAFVDKCTYAVCLPILFETVKLRSLEKIISFLHTVPRAYHSYIRDLELCTRSAYDTCPFSPSLTTTPTTPSLGKISITSTLTSFLTPCSSLERLSLSVAGGSVRNDIIDTFHLLTRVKKLSLSNWAQEEVAPLSERLVVSLVYALPKLSDLSLTRITRSVLHAPELIGNNYNSPSSWPSSASSPTIVPLVKGDENVPPHPVLGTQLRLPALLRLQNLRRLKIRDTHLGDAWWCASECPWVAGDGEVGGVAPLEVLDVGSSPYESAEVNQRFTERIMRNVPSTIQAFSLSTSLSSPTDSNPSSATQHAPTTPVQPIVPQQSQQPQQQAFTHLRTLHLTPLVPTSTLSTTLSQPQLSSSPVHTLSCVFHPDDGAEGCLELERFLLERVSSGVGEETVKKEVHGGEAKGRFRNLRKLSVTFAEDDNTSDSEAHAQHAFTWPPQKSLVKSQSQFEDDEDEDEERMEAALRLRKLCADLGLQAVIEGVPDDVYHSPQSDGEVKIGCGYIHGHGHEEDGEVKKRGRAMTTST